MYFNIIKTILVTMSSVLLIACVSSDSLDRSSTASSEARQSLPNTPISWKSAQQSIGDVKVGWLTTMNDELLTKLVEEAQQNNANLQLASTNVDSARALANQASSSLLPQVNLTAGGSRAGTQNSSGPRNLSLGVQTSWEVDMWGRIRSGEQASYQSLAAAESDYKYAQYSIAASVAQAYLAAIEANEQLAIAEQSISALEQTNKIVQVQFDNGIADQQNVSLARSDLASAQEVLASSKGAQRNAVRSLELLLGRYPEAELQVSNELPMLPEPVPAGIPSELLERRPDLLAAERRIAAAFNQLDQAKAARLPSLSLSGSLGGASQSLGSMLDPANIAWQAASSLLAPLFDGGLRKSQVDAANANQEAAIASYRQAALNAFAEVETALDQGSVLNERQIALGVSLKSAEEALRISELQYKEGEISLIDVLTIQQRVFSARRNLLSIERASLSQWVDLNLALGGAWE